MELSSTTTDIKLKIKDNRVLLGSRRPVEWFSKMLSRVIENYSISKNHDSEITFPKQLMIMF